MADLRAGAGACATPPPPTPTKVCDVGYIIKYILPLKNLMMRPKIFHIFRKQEDVGSLQPHVIAAPSK